MQAIATFARRAGTRPQVEPHGYFKDSRMRPDVAVTMGNKHKLVDVTIVHPTTVNRITNQQNQIKPLHTATQASKQKITKYSNQFTPAAYATSTHIIPFAAETYGGLTKESRHFIIDLARCCKDYGSIWSTAEIMRGLAAAVAIAIQRGNALTLMNGYRQTMTTTVLRQSLAITVPGAATAAAITA